MKKQSLGLIVKTLAGASLMGALMTPSIASAEVSANIGAVSNYYFRGVTQTSDATAIQGGVDYADPSGFYAGTWASNVDFGDTDQTSYEVDFYAGFGGEVDGLGYDLGYIYYAYPDTDDADFGEIYGSLSLSVFSVGLAYTAHSQVDDPGLFVQGDLYYYVSAALPLENDFSLGLTLGYYDFTDDGDAAVGDASYGHGSLSLAKDAGDMGEFSLNLEYADIDEADALGSSNSDDPKLWLGWSKGF